MGKFLVSFVGNALGNGKEQIFLRTKVFVDRRLRYPCLPANLRYRRILISLFRKTRSATSITRSLRVLFFTFVMSILSLRQTVP